MDHETFDEPCDNGHEPECDCPYESLPPLLISEYEAADLLCISRKTLRVLVKRDRLRCVEFVAAGFNRPIRRFRVEDLIRFIEESVV
jgi:hypothetical protein